MNKFEKDKLRASVLYKDEMLKVKYTGNSVNFPKNKIINAIPRFAMGSGLPYPSPKWIACCYYITDLDGDAYKVADKRYGELAKGFEWVR